MPPEIGTLVHAFTLRAHTHTHTHTHVARTSCTHTLHAQVARTSCTHTVHAHGARTRIATSHHTTPYKHACIHPDPLDAQSTTTPANGGCGSPASTFRHTWSWCSGAAWRYRMTPTRPACALSTFNPSRGFVHRWVGGGRWRCRQRTTMPSCCLHCVQHWYCCRDPTES